MDLEDAINGVDLSVKNIQRDDKTIATNKGSLDDKSRQVTADAQRDRNQQVDKIVNVGDSHPQNAQINIHAGEALVGVGEPKRSLPLLDRAVDVSTAKNDVPSLSHALFSRAAANAALQDYPGVVRDAKHILALDPNNQQAQMLVSLYSGRVAGRGGGDIQTDMQPGAGAGPGGSASPDASEDARRAGAAITRTAGELEAARLLSLASGKAALDPKAARALLDQALTSDPKNVQALLLRARLEKAGADNSAALSDADKAAQLAPRTAEAYFLRAQAKQALGYAQQDVAADYAKARELDPTLSGGELSALAGAPGAQGGSTLASEALAARARTKTIYEANFVERALDSIPPQYHKEIVGAVWVALVAALFLIFMRSVRRSP